jgi:hypothetical protein
MTFATIKHHFPLNFNPAPCTHQQHMSFINKFSFVLFATPLTIAVFLLAFFHFPHCTKNLIRKLNFTFSFGPCNQKHPFKV